VLIIKPLKCRMIDIDLPGCNSLYPRPLLPHNFGKWASLPINVIKKPIAEVEGYIEASSINLSALQTVYLSHSLSGSLNGIFTKSGENRSEILLGANAKRSVRLFCLCDRVVSGECWQTFSILQVSVLYGGVKAPLTNIRSKQRAASSCQRLILLAMKCYRRNVTQELKGSGFMKTKGRCCLTLFMNSLQSETREASYIR